MQGRADQLSDYFNSMDFKQLEAPTNWEAFLDRVLSTTETIQDLTTTLTFLKPAPFLQLKLLQRLMVKSNLFTFIKNMNDFLAIYYQFGDSVYADIFAGTRRFLSYSELREPDIASCQLREWIMEHGVHEGEMLGLLPAAVKDIQTLSQLFNCIPAHWMSFYYEKFHSLISQGTHLAILLNQLPLARCDRLLEIIKIKDGHLPMPTRDNANFLTDEKLILFKKYYGYPSAANAEPGVFSTIAAYVDRRLGSAWLGNAEELPDQKPDFKARDTFESKQMVTYLAGLVSADQEEYLAQLGNRLPKLCQTDNDYLAVRQQVIDPTLIIQYYLNNVRTATELVCGLSFLANHHATRSPQGWQYSIDEAVKMRAIQTGIHSAADLQYTLAHAPSWRGKILTTLGKRLFDLIDSQDNYDKAAQQDHLFLKCLLEKYIETPEQLAFLYNYCPSGKLYQTVVTNKTCANYFAFERFISNEGDLSRFFLGLAKLQREKFVTTMKELLATWYDIDAFSRVCSVFEPAERAELLGIFSAQGAHYRLGLFANTQERADEAAIRYSSAP